MKITKNWIAVMASVALLVSCSFSRTETGAFTGAEGEVRLITLDPGHFHAALVQKIPYPQVSDTVYVYAPEGEDVKLHLEKVNGYNTRTDNPTHWDEVVYLGSDYLERMVAEKKGNVMVMAGNNGKKTSYIKEALAVGIHVLADKPMAIDRQNFELLKECFALADQKGVLLYDIMTERFEITTMLQKEFSLIPSLYGVHEVGSPDNPSVVKESVHHFFKTVSGNPLIRPTWFYDVNQEGEGIVDVTTHLVDLVQWECFPGQIIDYTKDIEMLDANRWYTGLTPEQFKLSTGADSFPDYLSKDVKDGELPVYCNGDISYKINGIHAKVSVVWNFMAPEGTGDTHYSIMRGTKANLVIRQGEEQGYKPVLYIEAVAGSDPASFEKEFQDALAQVAGKYPGVTAVKLSDTSWQVDIPASYHTGHEAHFGQVTENYLQYLIDGALPAWEVPNMITKYYITSQGLELARAKE